MDVFIHVQWKNKVEKMFQGLYRLITHLPIFMQRAAEDNSWVKLLTDPVSQ